MVDTQFEEDRLISERNEIRAIQNISENEFYHFDTPFTVEHQIRLFIEAKFEDVDQVWRKEKTAIIVGKKAFK